MDPARPTREWRSRIGIVLQASRPDTYLTVHETVSEYADFYPAPRPVDETIEQVGLTESAGKRAGTLSGGQQRRLDVALGPVGDPDLIFLDEPTTGFVHRRLEVERPSLEDVYLELTESQGEKPA